jgi:hypothetical protein
VEEAKGAGKQKDPNHYTGSQKINDISTTQEAHEIVNNPTNSAPQQKRTKERTI